jgi:SNF2 family DNA or RNA helicase
MSHTGLAHQLVVVPPGLIDQWSSEINKFAPVLSVVKIYDFKSLETITVGQLIKADVVLCPIDMLVRKGFIEWLM